MYTPKGAQRNCILLFKNNPLSICQKYNQVLRLCAYNNYGMAKAS